MVFRLSFLKRIDILFCISAYISGLWGLNVVTYGILLLSLSFVRCICNRFDLFKNLILLYCLQLMPGDSFALKRMF